MDESVVRELNRLVGDAVRVVVEFRPTDYDLVHIRQDVRDEYSTDEIESIYHEVVAEGIAAEAIERNMRAGGLESRIFVFEEALVVIFNTRRYEGVCVTLDREAESRLVDLLPVVLSNIEPS